MPKGYGVVNECLNRLSKSNLRPVNKLKLEIALIQTKRLLLQLDFRNNDDSKSDAEIDNLYSKVCEVCASDGSGDLFHGLIRYIHKIQERLNLELKGE